MQNIFILSNLEVNLLYVANGCIFKFLKFLLIYEILTLIEIIFSNNH